MKTYKVVITETLERTVEVVAVDAAHAEELAEERWHNCEWVLGADDFVCARFEATHEVGGVEMG